ncbi:MAG TPA: hypothetical protein VIF62_39595, partial [Labilithrix sp.]
MKLALAFASFALLSAPLAAFAQDEPAPPLPEPPPQIEVRAAPPAIAPPAETAPPPKPAGRPRNDFIRIAMGPRFQYVKSA